MSSYYNEEWQRKKAYLIRSLFHEIPHRVLSPVFEESTRSTQSQLHEATPSSEDATYCPSYEDSTEVTVPDLGSAEDTRRPTSAASSPRTRPYSPLPPLIIEPVPNKHDEPKEYYRTLLKKIRRIYKKVFFDANNVSDYEDSYSMNDNLSLENVTFNSNGYTADLESTGSYESNHENTNFEENVYLENDYESDTDEQDTSASEEPAYSQITFEADIHRDGAPRPRARLSPIYEESSVESTITTIQIPQIFSECPTDTGGRASENIYNDQIEHFRLSSQENVKISQCVEIRDIEFENHDPNFVRTPVYDEYHNFMQKEITVIPKDVITAEAVPLESYSEDEEAEQEFVRQHLLKSPVFPVRSQYRTARQYRTVSNSNRDFIDNNITADTQITRSLCDDNRNKEDTAFVLRFNKSGQRSLLLGTDSPLLENNKEPETSPSTEENTDNLELRVVEEMRSSRFDTPRDSFATCAPRISYVSGDVSSEPNIAVENISNVTTEMVENEDEDARFQQRESDVDNILATIFTTGNKNDNLSIVAGNEHSRKRQHFKESSGPNIALDNIYNVTREMVENEDEDAIFQQRESDVDNILATIFTTGNKNDNLSNVSGNEHSRKRQHFKESSGPNIALDNIYNVTREMVENGDEVSQVQQRESDVYNIFVNTGDENDKLSNVSATEQCRKRRHLKESSAQTENVSWRDIRDNFFVGTPKIFRLCSCAGHICK